MNSEINPIFSFKVLFISNLSNFFNSTLKSVSRPVINSDTTFCISFFNLSSSLINTKTAPCLLSPVHISAGIRYSVEINKFSKLVNKLLSTTIILKLVVIQINIEFLQL